MGDGRPALSLVPRKADVTDRRREAFAVVFDAHWGAVRHHIECFVDDSDEVDEVVADVFGVAWEAEAGTADGVAVAASYRGQQAPRS